MTFENRPASMVRFAPVDPIRLLIVDDSPTIRRLIRRNLARHDDIIIVAEAGCARSARDAVNKYRPDVMTLDVEMPQMDGLEFLRRLMRARPMPVVMVSSLTQKGSRAAIEALSLGAIECIAKTGSDNDVGLAQLADVLRMAAHARVGQARSEKKTGHGVAQGYLYGHGYVMVGSSTGGVEAIETILGAYPENCPPTVITQHMPEPFLKNFARRLDRKFAPTVKLAEDLEPVEPGKVLIAPGGDFHMRLAGQARPHVVLDKGEKRFGHRPSVDVMFRSATFMAKDVIAVMLTGMGTDGAEAMLQLKNAGADCIAQDRETSVVYGMPRAAWELGAADVRLPIDQIAGDILHRTVKMPARPRAL